MRKELRILSKNVQFFYLVNDDALIMLMMIMIMMIIDNDDCYDYDQDNIDKK